MGMPGHLELLIIGLVALPCLIAPIAIALALFIAMRKKNGKPE